jgi:tetratricopeptide (TPR) repeat protein
MRGRADLSPTCLWVLLAYAGLLLVAACGGSEEREADYLARGKELYSEGNFTKASLEFRNALQINPGGIEPTYYLGLIAEQRNDLPSAYGAFQRVLELDPRHVQALLKVGQYTLAGGVLSSALDSAERVLAVDANNAEAYALRGAVRLRQASYDLAETDVSRAQAIDSGNLSAVAVLVGIRNKQKREAEALQLLDAALAAHPEADGLRAVKLQLLSNKGDLNGIEAILRQQIARRPHDIASRIELARLLTTQGRKDKAEQMLREGVITAPEDKDLKLLLAQYLLEHRSAELAAQELQAFATAAPEETAYRFALSQLYLGQRRFDEARAVINDLASTEETGTTALKARVRLAEIAYREGKAADAETMTSEILKIEPENPEALLLRSTIVMERGDNQSAIMDLRGILRTQPQSTIAMARLAKAHAANGDSTLAIDTYRSTLTLEPANDDLRLELVRHLKAQGRVMEAAAELDKIDANRSEHPAILYAKGENYLDVGYLDQAQSLAQRLLEGGDAVLGHTLAGRVLFSRGATEEAIAQFRAAAAADAKARDPMMFLVAALSRVERVQEAATYLEAIVAADPQNATALALMGDVYYTLGRPAEAEASLRSSVAAAPRWDLPYLKLGSLLLRNGNPQGASEVFRAGLVQIPGQLELMLRLGMTLEQQGDHDGARLEYEAILQKEPNQSVAANNLAALIADVWPSDRARLDQARRIAEGFRNTNQPLLLDTLGWVQLQLGNVDDAIALLERAVRADPNEQTLRYHLGRAYLARGDRMKAKAELEKAIAPGNSYRGIEDAKQVLASLT